MKYAIKKKNPKDGSKSSLNLPDLRMGSGGSSNPSENKPTTMGGETRTLKHDSSKEEYKMRTDKETTQT